MTTAFIIAMNIMLLFNTLFIIDGIKKSESKNAYSLIFFFGCFLWSSIILYVRFFV